MDLFFSALQFHHVEAIQKMQRLNKPCVYKFDKFKFHQPFLTEQKLIHKCKAMHNISGFLRILICLILIKA